MTGGEHGVIPNGDACTVTIHPTDRPADVLRAWALLPDGVGFAEAFGDVEVTLVFRPVCDLVPFPESDGWLPVPGWAADGRCCPEM